MTTPPLNVKLRKRLCQATRGPDGETVPGAEILQWDIQTPVGWVNCKTLDDARDIASEFGTTILL